MNVSEVSVFSNTSSSQPLNFGGRPVYWTVLSLVSAIFLIVSNFGLILGLIKTNEKLTISKKLYIYISLTDAFPGLVHLPYDLIVRDITKTHTTAVDVMLNHTHYLGAGTFFLISILRNLAIRKPLVKPSLRNVILFIVAWSIVVIAISIFNYVTFDSVKFHRARCLI